MKYSVLSVALLVTACSRPSAQVNSGKLSAEAGSSVVADPPEMIDEYDSAGIDPVEEVGRSATDVDSEEKLSEGSDDTDAAQPELDGGTGPSRIEDAGSDVGPSLPMDGGSGARAPFMEEKDDAQPDIEKDGGGDALLGDATDIGLNIAIPDAEADAMPPPLEELLRAKLSACNVIGPGEFHVAPVRDDYQACVTRCMLTAQCSELRHQYCLEEAPLLLNCIFECPAEPVTQPFECGDGQKVWTSFRCDGLGHCSNGADEAGCETFTCADGSKIAATTRCDGFPFCPDGSDERNCAATCNPP